MIMLCQNVQDIRRNQKAYRKYRAKRESLIDCRRKKLNRGDNRESDLLGKFVISINS